MTVLTTGYPSIDHIARVSHSPAVGETARLLAVPDRYTFGGCGANIAVALAKLGMDADVAMVLGDDDYAAAYLDYLAACGVHTENCLQLAGERTSHSYLFLNENGQCQNFFFPGAADAWRGKLHLRETHQYRCAVVTVGQLNYNRQFVQRVTEQEIPLVWVMKADVFSYPPEEIGYFLSRSYAVIMNHIEAEYILKALGRSAMTDLLSATTRSVVVTRGAEDALLHTTSETCAVPTVPPTALVDPTGAGDAFAAGFVAGLLCRAAPQVCVQLGSVLASFALEAIGCQTNLPSWDQAMARYQQHFEPFTVV